MQRALVRLALLMRIVPLLQAIATIALGFSGYSRPWLSVAAACVSLAWSGWLAARIWPTGRCPARLCAVDTAVAVLALIAVGAAMPPESLTTSFYWAGSYAAAVALMLGLSLPPRIGGYGLAALIAAYGFMVGVRAGPHTLPAAAGNAAGNAAYFGYGVLAAWYARRLEAVITRAEEDVLGRQALLGVQQARLEEFGRLHDEAVQVLERAAVTEEADAAPLRAYAARAAGHLRAAIEDRRPAGDSVAEALGHVAAGFAALRFGVTVDCAPLPDPGLRATGRLAAAVTEALNNACKHSGAAHASVRAAPAHGGIEVTVTDTGTGFPAGQVHDGFGIANCIRHRLAEAGGSVAFHSAPGAGTVVQMWLPCAPATGARQHEFITPASQAVGPAVAGPAATDTDQVSIRPDRALLLLGLASRTAYCLYAAAVLLLNLGGYLHPGWATAALVIAVAASAGLGRLVWRDQAFSSLVAALDSATALAVLVLVAAALRNPDRAGALNWALTYAVACAVWLGLGGRLSWRLLPACALGACYGVTALRGAAATPALTVTVAVNAASIPMYFGIAAAVTWVVRRIAAEMAASHALEQAQRRDLAALAERERLVGRVHQSVLATLERVTSGAVPWTELRGQARAQVIALRAAFGEPSGNGRPGGAAVAVEPGQPTGTCAVTGEARNDLRTLLAGLVRDRAGDGWRIDVIDEELTGGPAPAQACVLRDALAELVTGPAPAGCPTVRAQVRAAGAVTELVARIPRDLPAMAGPVAAARARLAPVSGTAELMPARPDEVRLRLRVPG